MTIITVKFTAVMITDSVHIKSYPEFTCLSSSVTFNHVSLLFMVLHLPPDVNS